MADEYKIGRLCTKIAGRDAGKLAVVVDVQDSKVVLDGNVRRRAVNKAHVIPYDKEVNIKKGASHEDVKKAFEELGFPVRDTTPKKVAEKPKKKVAKAKPAKEKKAEAKPAKGSKKEEKASK